MGNGASAIANQLTEVTNDMKTIQKDLRNTLISNISSAQSTANSVQVIEGVDIRNIEIKGCKKALTFEQDSAVTAVAIASIDQTVIEDAKTNFEAAADQVIDQVIDVEREFLSPEDKRKYITTLKGDMEQIIEKTFDSENISNAFANSYGEQKMTNLKFNNVIIDCEGIENSEAMTFTQRAQVDAIAQAIVEQVVEQFTETEGFQEYSGKVESDYTYKGTGPIGEYMTGLANIVSSMQGPLIALAVLAFFLLIGFIMFKGKKAAAGFKKMK